VTAPRSTPSGVVRLLNTADGRVLCLAGAVDEALVDAFLRHYGREPVRIDVVEAGSVTSLSVSAQELVQEHLVAARAAGRSITVRPDRAALTSDAPHDQ